MFQLTSLSIDTEAVRKQVLDPAAGGFCSFEGRVRNQHESRPVLKLEYEAYAALAIKEGKRILAESIQRFGILHAACVHRTGSLEIGEMAVYVCVSSTHRDAAFDACRYIIEEVKSRLPVWKKEFFENGNADWVRCDHCEEHQ